MRKPRKIRGYGNELCTEDWIEMYEIHESGRTQKIGRFCSESSPGPYFTDQGIYQMKIIFNSDESAMASGFNAFYRFWPARTQFGDCGSNITGGISGFIETPGYDVTYKGRSWNCNWYITVRSKHQVRISFIKLSIEGGIDTIGCKYAVARVWQDLSKPPVELCGPSILEPKDFLSTSNVLRVSFSAIETSKGAEGFRAVWTEVKDDVLCDMFKCPKSGFCISNVLKCNGVPNCGFDDPSDEIDCIKVTEVNKLMMVAMVLVGGILLGIIICSLCHKKHRRRRSNSTISQQFDINRTKPSHDLSPSGIHPYLSVESV